MFRVWILIPEGLTFDMLPEEQQAAINLVFGRFVLPMPSTIPADGQVICDALTADNFKPETMPEYGINWPIIGMWDFEGNTFIPLNVEELQKRLVPDEVTQEVVLCEPHSWAGWPKIKELENE